MIPERLLPEIVTWQRPGSTTDRYGNPIDDWTAPVEEELRVRIEQTAANEVDGQTGPAAFGQWRLFTNELTVAAGHRFLRGDDEFEVDGPPFIVWGERAPHHIEARLAAVQT